MFNIDSKLYPWNASKPEVQFKRLTLFIWNQNGMDAV